ncbi:hypothetical protein Ddc_10312 [Ditylenchus destructor]|nr:hypothetical protein Ddc_10312 [Ditylenchus destructor]
MSGETNDALYAGLGDDEHRQELRKRGMNARPITRSTGKISGQNGVHEKSPISVRGGSSPPQQVNKPVPELDFSKEDDSSDDDAEESARTLSPEEAARFRSNIQRTSGAFRGRHLNGEVATSTPVMRNVSVLKAKGNFNYSIPTDLIAHFAMLLSTLAFYYGILSHNSLRTVYFFWLFYYGCSKIARFVKIVLGLIDEREAKGDFNYGSIAKFALLLFTLAFIAVLFYLCDMNWQHLRDLQKAYLSANKTKNAEDEL